MRWLPTSRFFSTRNRQLPAASLWPLIGEPRLRASPTIGPPTVQRSRPCQSDGLEEADISSRGQGTLLLPPSSAIAFHPLPSTRTLLTICALRPAGKARVPRRQTNRDEDDQRRTPRALLPAALCGSLVRHLLAARARFLQGFWHLCESVKNFFACGGQQGVRSHRAIAMLLPAGG